MRGKENRGQAYKLNWFRDREIRVIIGVVIDILLARCAVNMELVIQFLLEIDAWLVVASGP
jgi:hypothetical protein